MNIKTYLQVKGMSCKNCESKIVSHINSNPSVLKCSADYASGIVVIEHEDNNLDIQSIINSTETELGYKSRVISPSLKNWIKIYPTLIGLIAVLVLYIVAVKTGVLNNIPQITEKMNYSILFVVGLMTSIHCIGMCGGINLSQTCSALEESKINILKRGVSYNLGRLLSYTIIGGIVGGIGTVLSISLTMQSIIIIGAGIIMIIMGANMLGLLSFLKKIVPVIPASFGTKIIKYSKNKNSFFVGFLNGFMPCGPLQSMQLYALSTGSIIKGAFSMFLFSAGTIPLMLLFGTIGSFFSVKKQKNILRISAFLVLILGLSMINRGLSLNGIEVNKTPSKTIESDSAIASIKGDKQIVISSVTSRAYEPIIVQAGIPVEWTLHAENGAINGCNNAIISRDFNINTSLNVGDTTVTFTPEKPGNYIFTCWMGMITSNIIVVEDLSSIDPESLQSSTRKSQETVEITIPEYNKTDIVLSEIVNGKQYSELKISSLGFEKSIIVMEKNRETEWTFIPNSLDAKTSRLLFPNYKAQMDLIDGTNNSVVITPEADLYFYTVSGDYLGFVILVDDLNSVDNDLILQKVRSYIGSN